jgi:hypothetical protein
LGWASGTDPYNNDKDTILTREAAAILQLGLDAAGTVAYTLKGNDRITSDGVGGDLTIAAGRGYGAAGGSLYFQTAPTIASGNPGVLATRGGFAPTGELNLYTSLDLSATTSKTYYQIIKSSAAEGLAGEDLRIGLDESIRLMYICDRDDIATDLGFTAQTQPTLVWLAANGTNYSTQIWNNIACPSLWTLSSWVGVTISASPAIANTAIALTHNGVRTNTSGQSYAVAITTAYNQASGTASNTDLFINRTETAVGSGAQLLIDAQVGAVSKFKVTNAGAITADGGLQTYGANDSGGSGYRLVRVPNV